MPEEHAEWQLAYWKARTYSRRARIALMPGSWSSADWHNTLKAFDYRCSYCGIHRKLARFTGHDLEADHLVSYRAGLEHPRIAFMATNNIDNIVPACKSCNSSKSERFILDWLKTQRIATDMHPLLAERLRRISRYIDNGIKNTS